MKSQTFLNVRCHAIFSDMLSHLAKGLLTYERSPKVDLKGVEAAFAQACIDKDATLAFRGPVPGTPPAAEQSVIRHYVRRVRDAQLEAKKHGRVEPYVLGLNHDEFITQYGEVFGEGFVISAKPLYVSGSRVAFAMERALWLFQYSSSLVLIAGFLQELAQKFNVQGAEPALGEARMELHQRCSRYLRDYASFALMLNDPEHSAKARRTLYEEAYAPCYAVSSYILGNDRYDLGGRMGDAEAASEDAFRAELKQLCNPAAGSK